MQRAGKKVKNVYKNGTMVKKNLREFPAVRADFAGAELYYARIINPRKSNKNN